MSVLTSVIELKNGEGVKDVEELLPRIDAMHDEFTADPTVLSADIFSDNGTEISIMLKIHALDGEEKADVQMRTDELCAKAFAVAKIEVEDKDDSLLSNNVREFALASI